MQWQPDAVDADAAAAAEPETDATAFRFDNFDVGYVLRHGKQLLGSSGAEYRLTEEMRRMGVRERLQQQRAMLQKQLRLRPEHEAGVETMIRFVLVDA